MCDLFLLSVVLGTLKDHKMLSELDTIISMSIAQTDAGTVRSSL